MRSHQTQEHETDESSANAPPPSPYHAIHSASSAAGLRSQKEDALYQIKWPERRQQIKLIIIIINTHADKKRK